MKGFLYLLVFIFLIWQISLFADDGSQIDNDEIVTFFPSYGSYDEFLEIWTLHIEGWIREPNDSDIVKHTLILGFELFTKINIPNKNEFWNRISPLASDNEGKEKIIIELGDKKYTMSASTDGGRISESITLSNFEAQKLAEDGWITYNTTAKDGRKFFGKIQLVPPVGKSVISDIDDTIKITGIVEGKKTVLKNSFINPPQACPGMSQTYQKMQQSEIVFHYLTGSPWQMFDFLNNFRQSNSFPAGSFNMKEFRINPLSSEFWEAIAKEATIDQKKTAIKEIIESYPHRQFILIGDSGEKDPEIYAWAVHAYNPQISEVLIRNITNETTHNERMTSNFGNEISRLKLIDPSTGAIQIR